MKGTVFFDLDGTLLQSRIHIRAAIQQTAQDLGFPPIPVEKIDRLIGEPAEVFYQQLVPDGVDPAELHKAYQKNERRILAEQGCLFPGTDAMLQTLFQEDFRLVICSYASTEYATIALETTKARQYFSDILSAKGFPSKADALKQALPRFPDKPAIFVGDRCFDFDAAARNSIPCIGVRYGYSLPEELPQATYVADSPADITALVRQIAAAYDN